MNQIDEELSALVIAKVEELFPAPTSNDVIYLLMEECGKSTLYRKMDWSDLSERVQCAVLKLSDGDVGKLKAAIILYKENWKQLLHEANFGSDETAHQVWAKSDAA